MKPHRLIALLLAASPFVHGSPESDKALVALAEKLARAEKVTAIKSAKDLDWMAGKWKCTERALRGPRDIQTYAICLPFLDTIVIEDDPVARTTETAGTYQQVLLCKFLGRTKDEKTPTDTIVCDIDAKGYRFFIPSPDWLWLKKEPVEKPNWFILQHQDTGDVLLFERVPEKPNAPRR
jgi:hypothetical protein